MRGVKRRRLSPGIQQRGFTLLEIVVALGILALSLVMLLTTQARSMENAARTRDLSIATLLTRSKLIDIEQELQDEGFPEGDHTDEGNFSEEGYAEIKWKVEVSEIELDISGLLDMCEGFEEGDDSGGGEDEAGGCAGMLGGLGAPLDTMMDDISNSIRLLDLTVTWPTGPKYTEDIYVRSIVTKEDLALQQATDQQRQNDTVNSQVQRATEMLRGPGQTGRTR